MQQIISIDCGGLKTAQMNGLEAGPLTSHRVVSEIHQMRELRVEWDALLQSCELPNVFLTFEWCSAWAESFLLPGDLRLICLYRGAQLVGIVPLCICRRWGIRTLAFIGSRDADYLGVIAGPEWFSRTIQALADWLQLTPPEWDIVQFRDVTGELMGSLRQALPCRYRALSRRSEVCPYIPIHSTWEEFTSQRKDRFRKLRQTVNKCLRKANVEFIDDGLALSQLEHYITDIQMASWKAAEGRLMFRSSHARFWRMCLDRMLSAGMVSYCVMTMDGVPAAFTFSLLYRNKVFFYCTGYKTGFASCSVGSVVTEHVVRNAFQLARDEFDFMRGDEEYKALWTCDERCSYELVAYRGALRSWLGAVVLHRLPWYLRGKKWARRLKILYRTTRERLRRQLARAAD